jgi:hypothetical protein
LPRPPLAQKQMLTGAGFTSGKCRGADVPFQQSQWMRSYFLIVLADIPPLKNTKSQKH